MRRPFPYQGQIPMIAAMSTTRIALCAALCSLGSLSAQNAAASVESGITTSSIASHLRFLSHDLLEGRGVGSRGDALSRLYISSQFEQYGLTPGGKDGSWEQPVPIIGISSKVTTAMTVTGTDGMVCAFEAPTDYTMFAGHPGAATSWKGAEVVFVGYGIDAPEQNWDDFKGVDLKGKVILVMNNDPESDPKLFGGKTRLYYGRWSYKYEEAARRGAVGAIVIHTTPSAGYPFQVIQAGHGHERFWLPFEEGAPTLEVRSWCSEDAARTMAKMGGHDLDVLRASAETRDFKPVSLGIKIDLAADNTVREIQSGNVLAVLPGTDEKLKDEVCVISAHFDHLGIGTPKKEDAIYNGGLDNASGTAAMLAIARACSQLEFKPRRTLLFLSVTAEESGLLGSKYYAFHPTFPKKKIVANFNIDGINIWGPTKDIEMIGYGKNSLTDVARDCAERRGRVLEANKRPDLGLFYRSDHFSFARIGVPAAYFKAGGDFYENKRGRNRVKSMFTTTRYHQPSDEFDRRWNLHGAVEDSRLILECLLRTANADIAPTWTAGDEFEKLR